MVFKINKPGYIFHSTILNPTSIFFSKKQIMKVFF